MTRLVYADDLRVGEAHDAGSFLVTTPDIIAFARQWDPLPVHTDEHTAAGGPFGEIIASGIHSFGIFQRLSVLNVYPGWQIIAGRTVRELEFPKPVRGGATLRATITIDGVEERSRGRSIVYKNGLMVDDEGDAVFRMRSEIYMWSRSGGVGGVSGSQRGC